MSLIGPVSMSPTVRHFGPRQDRLGLGLRGLCDETATFWVRMRPSDAGPYWACDALSFTLGRDVAYWALFRSSCSPLGQSPS